jgi:hypothetical protein
MGSGGVSKNETIIRLRASAECRVPRSRLLGLCRPSTYAKHTPTTHRHKICLCIPPRLALLIDMYTHLLSVFSPTMSMAPALCTVYHEKSARQNIENTVCSRSLRRSKNHTQVSPGFDLAKGIWKGPNLGNYNLVPQKVVGMPVCVVVDHGIDWWPLFLQVNADLRESIEIGVLCGLGPDQHDKKTLPKPRKVSAGVQSAECQASAGFCGARTEMKLANDEIDGYVFLGASMGSCLGELGFHYRPRHILLGRPSCAPCG